MRRSQSADRPRRCAPNPPGRPRSSKLSVQGPLRDIAGAESRIARAKRERSTPPPQHSRDPKRPAPSTGRTGCPRSGLVPVRRNAHAPRSVGPPRSPRGAALRCPRLARARPAPPPQHGKGSERQRPVHGARGWHAKRDGSRQEECPRPKIRTDIQMASKRPDTTEHPRHKIRTDIQMAS